MLTPGMQDAEEADVDCGKRGFLCALVDGQQRGAGSCIESRKERQFTAFSNERINRRVDQIGRIEACHVGRGDSRRGDSTRRCTPLRNA